MIIVDNLKLLGNPSISLAKALLLFYVIIASNFTKELYSGQLKDFLSSNRYAQHIMGIISMLVLIGIIGGVTNVKQLIVLSIIAYLWFILTTKLDLKWNIAIIGLLLIGYLYENSLLDKEKQLEKDPSLEKKEKKIIKKKYYDTKLIIFISILVITVIGSVLYYNKKIDQHGGNFDSLKFLVDGRNIIKNSQLVQFSF